MPLGQTPIEMRMAADQARAAMQNEMEAHLQGLQRKLNEAMKEHQHCQAGRWAFSSDQHLKGMERKTGIKGRACLVWYLRLTGAAP
jgi:hypothetical protein